MDMSQFNIGLMQDGNVFIGRVRDGKWHGEKKIITNEFITTMLMKFEPNQEFDLTMNGVPTFNLLIRKIEQKAENHPSQMKLFDKKDVVAEEDCVTTKVAEDLKEASIEAATAKDGEPEQEASEINMEITPKDATKNI